MKKVHLDDGELEKKKEDADLPGRASRVRVGEDAQVSYLMRRPDRLDTFHIQMFEITWSFSHGR